MAAGLQVLPPNLGHDMGLPAVALLQLLEAFTGVGYCSYCCMPGSWCTCVGASQPVPPESWSQVVEQTPGYGMAASSGGMTTPSTSVAGMPGYVAPSPGITPPDLSSWSLPPPEDPLPQGLPAASQGLSCREVYTNQGCGQKTGSGAAHAVSKGSGPTCSDTAPGGTTHPSGGATSPSATTWVASYSVPAGSTAAW